MASTIISMPNRSTAALPQSRGKVFGNPIGYFGDEADITSWLLVREDFLKCDNGGVGGSCQARCLLYTFIGGLGDDGFAKNLTNGAPGRGNSTVLDGIGTQSRGALLLSG
ncbi:hypothetical protein GGS20DRAFT_570558 [Poronia punctata]|nr:hypothetical protein GGS20DRAFT_570558 [Poronia punctata]